MSSSNVSSSPLSRHGPHRGSTLGLLASLGFLLGLAVAAWLALDPLRFLQHLGPGTSLTQSLQDGNGRRYVLPLAAGDFVRILVDQGQPDVEVRLIAPSGREILTVDDPESQREDEDLAAIAAVTGFHRVEVRPFPGAPLNGSFGLRVVEGPRPATQEDRWRAEATALTQRAAYLRVDGKRQEEVQLRQKALPLWQRLGDRTREARMLLDLGLAHHDLGDHQRAASCFHAAAGRFEKIGDAVHQANALNGAARVDRQLGRGEEAQAHLERALQLSQRGSEMEATVLNNLGDLHADRDPEAAIRYFQRSLRTARELRSLDQPQILNNLGFAYRSNGQWEEAVQSFGEALSLSQHRRDPRGEAYAHNSLGGIYQVVGKWDEAIGHYEQALQLLAPDDPLRAATLNNLALLYQKSGQRRKALDHYRQALDLGSEGESRVKALSNMALLQLELNRPAQAVELCRQALPLAAGNLRLEAPVLESLGRAQTGTGELRAARGSLDRALAIVRGMKDRHREAAVTLALAEVERAEGNLPGALERAEDALRIVESLRTGMADLDLRASFLATKIDYYEIYIDLLMALHQAHPTEGYEARALQASEMARARSLLDILGEAAGDPLQRAASREAADARRLRAVVIERDLAHQRLLAAGASPERLEESERRLTLATESYNRVLRAYQPKYAALAQEQPLDLPGIQSRVLGEKTLLLEYSLGTGRSFLWAVTPDSVHSFVLPPRAVIEEAARGFYGSVTARNLQVPGEKAGARDRRIAQADRDVERAAAQLSRMLLMDVESLLGEGTKVLVVADGALQYVPFFALPLPSSLRQGKPLPLIRRHEVVSLPSASVLAVLRRELGDEPPAPKELAVLADPVFGKDDPRFRQDRDRPEPALRLAANRDLLPSSAFSRLPYSGIEAKGILGLVSPARSFEALGFEASREAATSGRLDDYRIVHFATHGQLDNQQPELSRLVLSLIDEKGRDRDGYLRLLDVYDLQLNADLVVLSACQTALGQETRGEGLVGLTRGFMFAGAKRVLASLWSVDDRSTAQLMKRFYENQLRRGESPAAALRHAQIWMSEKPLRQSPYFWAGFSLQGEWR